MPSKPGRPPKDPHTHRRNKLTLSLTDHELHSINLVAEDRKLPPSILIRELALLHACEVIASKHSRNFLITQKASQHGSTITKTLPSPTPWLFPSQLLPSDFGPIQLTIACATCSHNFVDGPGQTFICPTCNPKSDLTPTPSSPTVPT